MTLEAGDVVWHQAPFKRETSNGTTPSRPWLLVSNERHPFQGIEYVALGMTTSDHHDAIELRRESWVEGGSEKRSFVSPWFVMTLKREDVTQRIGTLEASVLARALDKFTSYVGPAT